jgi:hypothetical protein
MPLCCAGSRNERVAIDETGVRVCKLAINFPLFPRAPRTPNVIRASPTRAGGPGRQHQNRLWWGRECKKVGDPY